MVFILDITINKLYLVKFVSLSNAIDTNKLYRVRYNVTQYKKQLFNNHYI